MIKLLRWAVMKATGSRSWLTVLLVGENSG